MFTIFIISFRGLFAFPKKVPETLRGLRGLKRGFSNQRASSFDKTLIVSTAFVQILTRKRRLGNRPCDCRWLHLLRFHYRFDWKIDFFKSLGQGILASRVNLKNNFLIPVAAVSRLDLDVFEPSSFQHFRNCSVAGYRVKLR
jgi:hypothetical protein